MSVPGHLKTVVSEMPVLPFARAAIKDCADRRAEVHDGRPHGTSYRLNPYISREPQSYVQMLDSADEGRAQTFYRTNDLGIVKAT